MIWLSFTIFFLSTFKVTEPKSVNFINYFYCFNAMIELKWFNKWDVTKVLVTDPGLKKYIELKPMLVPKSFGRNSNQRFGKSKCAIVERLMNKIQVTGHKGKKHHRTSGHMTGKGLHTYDVTQQCLEIVEKIKGKSPVAISGVINSVNAYFSDGINGFEKEVEEFGKCFGTDDFKEGTAAFLEKRKAIFTIK